MTDIKLFEGLTAIEAAQGTMFDLYSAIFSIEPNIEVQERLKYMPDLLLLLAYDTAGQAVGFKLGYREDPLTFYSWLGGVLPEARGQHIAARMMAMQHAWCKEKGYQFVRTKTLNQWRTMLILNLQFGFEIIGTQVGRTGVVKVVLEKKL